MFWDVDVFNEMDRLRREMNSLFSGYDRSAPNSTYPLLNVYEDKDNVIVTGELPGMTKDKVSITYSEDMLTLSGKHEPDGKIKNMTVVRKERSEGNFEKSIKIPTKIKSEEIKASFKNGVLTITLPKADEVKPRTISIEA